MSQGGQAEKPKTRVRSPAYPSIDLKTAISYAKMIYDAEKRAAAPVAVVAEDCGLDIKNSPGLRAIAALKQFGLGIEEGANEDRQLRLSDRALDILLAHSENSTERNQAIKAAALAPKIHSHLWQMHKGELPSDGALKTYLIRKMEFNDAHVDRFIKQFRDTVAFAKLVPDDTITTDDSGDDDEELDDETNHDDIDRDTPKKETGDSQQNTPNKLRIKQPGMSQSVYPLPEGDAVIQWPEELSTASFEDLKDWLELAMRTIKRSVKQESQEATPLPSRIGHVQDKPSTPATPV